MRTYIQVHEKDNVAIAVQAVRQGTGLLPGVVALDDIPQGHKIALQDIPQDGAIIRYGVTLGYALAPIAPRPVGQRAHVAPAHAAKPGRHALWHKHMHQPAAGARPVLVGLPQPCGRLRGHAQTSWAYRPPYSACRACWTWR